MVDRRRKWTPFVRRELPYALVCTGLVAGLGFVGGRHALMFGAVLFIGVSLLRGGFHWAMHGTGYWPQGRRGVVFYGSMFVLLPLLVILLGQVFVGKLGDQRIWWWPP